MSKSDSQNKHSFKPQPKTSPAGLLKYVNFVLDDIERLKGSPHVNKYVRTELSIAYHETKKAVEKIRAQNPAIKKMPPDSNDPREYLRNVHTWCVGQLFWENGEPIGETPAETEPNTSPSKCRIIIGRLTNHPHSYGLTGGVIFLILFFVVGFFKPQWRNWCWGVAGLAFLVLILSLLGGRSRQ